MKSNFLIFFRIIIDNMVIILRIFISLRLKPEMNSLHKIIEDKNLKNCVVLGNGPSLKESLDENFNFFQNKIKICLNSFSQSEYFEKLKPEFYVFSDPAYWSNTNDISQKCSQIVKETLTEILKKTSWNIIIIIAHNAKKNKDFYNIFKSNKFIKIVYYNNFSTLYEMPYLSYLFYKKNLCMVHPQTVLNSAIFFAINLGFKSIYIFGADHSWLKNLYVDENNILNLVDTHFYSVTKSPFYKLNGIDTFTIAESLLCFFKMFKSHEKISRYANYRKANVFNCSKESYIDAYKKLKI